MKTYYFSKNNAHDIEYYANFLFNQMQEEQNIQKYNRLHQFYNGKLLELRYAIRDTGNYNVAFLTGEQIGLAKKIMLWALNRREQINNKIKKGE